MYYFLILTHLPVAASRTSPSLHLLTHRPVLGLISLPSGHSFSIFSAFIFSHFPVSGFLILSLSQIFNFSHHFSYHLITTHKFIIGYCEIK